MDELEVLEDLERGLVDESETDSMDSQEVQTDNGGDDARGLDEVEAADTEVSDEVAATDNADTREVVALGDAKGGNQGTVTQRWPQYPYDDLYYYEPKETDTSRLSWQMHSSAHDLMQRIGDVESNVIAAVGSGSGSGSGSGTVTIDAEQWQYIHDVQGYTLGLCLVLAVGVFAMLGTALARGLLHGWR